MALFLGIKSSRLTKIMASFIFCLACLGISPLIAPIFANMNGELEEISLKDTGFQMQGAGNPKGNESTLTKVNSSSQTATLVDMGVYVKNLGKFNYKDNNFFINLYIWWISDNPDYYPEKTVEFSNAEVFKQLFFARDRVQNRYRTLARYTATINCTPPWDLTHFPFDRQKFRVSFEENIADIEHVRFSPLSSETKISPDVILKGWNLDGFEITHEPHVYSTNFGDIDRPTSTYSRINLIFNIKRQGELLFFVTFIGFIVSIFLSCVTFFVPKRYFDTNNTLCLGAIFAGIGNKYQLGDIISAYDLTSLMGVLVVSTFMVVLVAIVNNLVVHTLVIGERVFLSRFVNYSTFAILLLIYGSVVGRAIQVAIES